MVGTFFKMDNDSQNSHRRQDNKISLFWSITSSETEMYLFNFYLCFDCIFSIATIMVDRYMDFLSIYVMETTPSDPIDSQFGKKHLHAF